MLMAKENKINVVRSSSIKSFLEKKKDQGFVISALNLFMLGYLLRNKEFINKSYFWCDGIMGVFFLYLKGESITKLRGPNFIKEVLSYFDGKNICVLGNLQDNSKAAIEKYNIKIIQHIPFENFDIKKFELFDIQSNIIICTLPSPKQEDLSIIISKLNPDVKFFCVGGAVEMISDSSLDCPDYLQKLGLEFLFRLKHDFIRRITRLIKSFILLLINSPFILKSKVKIDE